MNPLETYNALQSLLGRLAAIGGVYEPLLMVAAGALLLAGILPPMARWRGWALTAMAVLLVAGEGVLIWFHWRLYQIAQIVDPSTGASTGAVAVPLWVESEKLFVWALLVAVLGVFMRRQRRELVTGVVLMVAVLSFGAALLGKPFTQPVPQFVGQYMGYLQAYSFGGTVAAQAYEGLSNSARYYYNAWYMWVHPPLLFLSYAAFAISFIATLRMIFARHSSYETTAYRWARFGYLPLTLGMLLGFPWAILAWSGESWWWSGKVNMSIMMWLLYTAYLHARLYLRRAGMWKAVAALAVVSFLILVLTYVTTYVVPGAHSYAASGAPAGFAAAVLEALSGGAS